MNHHEMSASTSRIEALRAKHASLKSRIESEQRLPSTTDFYLRQLKKQKLLLKEEIERISSSTVN